MGGTARPIAHSCIRSKIIPTTPRATPKRRTRMIMALKDRLYILSKFDVISLSKIKGVLRKCMRVCKEKFVHVPKESFKIHHLALERLASAAEFPGFFFPGLPTFACLPLLIARVCVLKSPREEYILAPFAIHIFFWTALQVLTPLRHYIIPSFQRYFISATTPASCYQGPNHNPSSHQVGSGQRYGTIPKTSSNNRIP